MVSEFATMREDWLTCPVPSPEAGLRLFCVPYAGAGGSVFRSWCQPLAGVAEVWPVQLPGREQRCDEPLLTSIPQIAVGISAAISRSGDLPFALFGHSMGAMVAFETARELRRQGLPLPRLLIVSASHAPSRLGRRRHTACLPDEQFIAEMSALGGSLAEAFEIPELKDFVLPILRADVTACDGYRPCAEPPLEVPIAVFYGLEDQYVGRDMMEPWQLEAEASAGIHAFDGNHFFLHTRRRQVLETIRTLCLQSSGRRNPVALGREGQRTAPGG